MTDHNSSPNTLPLEALLERLELAGFNLSPATRMRAVSVLDQMSRFYIDQPQRLKFILAPIIAKNANEQQRFYEVFDQYWQDITAPPSGPASEETVPEHLPAYLRWLWIIPALVLAGLAYIFWPTPIVTDPEPNVYFETKHQVKAGDSVHVVLITEHIDPDHCIFSWTFLDSIPDRKSKVLFTQTHQKSWSFVMNYPGEKSGKKFLRLQVTDTVQEKSYRQQQAIQISCQSPPVVRGPLGPARAEANEPLVFTANQEEEGPFRYEWQFGDGTSSQEKNPSHSYTEDGAYTIRLRVWDPTNAYPCETFVEHQISIGPEKAYLPLRMMAYDEVKPNAYFTQFYWLLIGLLGVYALHWIGRWTKRPYPPDPKEKQKEKLAASFASIDKAPYFIPFRSQNQQIIIDTELYRLAAVLRQREEGIGKKIDVKATIHHTVKEGGFPKIALASRTQPTEYLVLIDEKSPESHQARLFGYLVELLRDQDVLLQIFYYHESFNWFWDAAHPKGISAQTLQRMYPHHRLIVMGDAHELLDPFAREIPKLREKEAHFIRSWQHRLLFTPIPQSSWTYREEVLYRLFYLFSADTEGLSSAANFLESLAWEEDSPPRFERWIRLLNFRSDPSTNYRRWRRLKDYQDYLADRPDLLRWLYALAVFPKPQWETTVAIGKAIGAEVNYNNLLILARIPWLQKGEISPKLQQLFLQQLSPEEEQLARKAVLGELTAVEKISENSYSNLSVKTGIAIQEFSLEPNDLVPQEKLSFLLDEKLLNKKQIAELNNRLQRQQEEEQEPVSSITKESSAVPPDTPDIREFLRDQKEKAAESERPTRPVYTREWYFAALTSVLFLLLLPASLLLNKTDQLYQLAFGELPVVSTENADRELKSSWYLISEKLQGNEAALLNNDAVSTFETMIDFLYQGAVQAKESNRSTLIESQSRLTRTRLNEALQKDPDYELAHTNRNKLDYFLGYEVYSKFLEDLDTSRKIGDAIRFFYPLDRQFYDPSLQLDFLHAAGLIHHYTYQADSAQLLLDRIERLSDRQYFDTLSQFPNLRSLLYRAQPAYQINGRVIAAESRQQLGGVTVTVVDRQLLDAGYTITTTTSNSGDFSLELPAGYRPAKTLLRLTRRSYRRQESTVVFDSSFVRVVFELAPNPLPEEIRGPDQLVRDSARIVETNDLSREPGNIPSTFSINPGGDLPPPQYFWCIDPGLTAQTEGKTSPALDDGRRMAAYEFNWDIARRIYRGLQTYGRRATITLSDPNTPDDPNLRLKRIEGQNSSLPKVVVNINSNAGATTSSDGWSNANGIKTWYKRESQESQVIAETFQSKLLKATGWKDNGITVSQSQNEFYLFNNLEIPVIQTESGFYNNQTQLRELLKESVRQRIADAHIAAILECEKVAYAQKGPESPPTFETGLLTDPRDQKRYNTVIIGGQEWMAQNLNYQVPGSECYPNVRQQAVDCVRLYTYQQANQACPKGWRLPTIDDWNQLIDQLLKDNRCSPLPDDRAPAAFAALIPDGCSRLKLDLEGYAEKGPKGIVDYRGRGDIGLYWSSTRVDSDNSQEGAFDETYNGDPIYFIELNGDIGRLTIRQNTEQVEKMPCRCVR